MILRDRGSDAALDCGSGDRGHRRALRGCRQLGRNRAGQGVPEAAERVCPAAEARPGTPAALSVSPLTFGLAGELRRRSVETPRAGEPGPQCPRFLHRKRNRRSRRRPGVLARLRVGACATGSVVRPQNHPRAVKDAFRDAPADFEGGELPSVEDVITAQVMTTGGAGGARHQARVTAPVTGRCG